MLRLWRDSNRWSFQMFRREVLGIQYRSYNDDSPMLYITFFMWRTWRAYRSVCPGCMAGTSMFHDHDYYREVK